MTRFKLTIQVVTWLTAVVILLILVQYYFVLSLDMFDLQLDIFYYFTLITILVFSLILIRKKYRFYNLFLFLLVFFAPIKLYHGYIFDYQIKKSIRVAEDIVKDVNIFFDSKQRYPSDLLEIYPKGEPKYFIGLMPIKFNYSTTKSKFQIGMWHLNGYKYIYYSSIKTWILAD